MNIRDRHLKGRDIPGWSNPDQDITIAAATSGTISSWYFPHEEGGEAELCAALRRDIDALLETQREARDRAAPAIIAGRYFTEPGPRAALQKDIEELLEESAPD